MANKKVEIGKGNDKPGNVDKQFDIGKYKETWDFQDNDNPTIPPDPTTKQVNLS